MSEQIPDIMGIVTDEHVVLKAYDGDYTAEQIDRLNPEVVEQITIHNGEIIDHWKKGADPARPTPDTPVKPSHP